MSEAEMGRMSDCEGTGLSYAGVRALVSICSSDVLDHCRDTEHLIDTECRGKNDAQETTEK